jgi:ABC-type proline/glycine betaine transport system permease subunit
MVKEKFNPRFGILAILIVIAALSRLIPHPPNFSPIGGMALFGAAYFSRKHWAILVPIIALWVSSLILDNTTLAHYYDHFVWFSHPYVYISIILIVAFGWLTLKNVKPANLVGASLGASVIFFLVSNFGVWLASTVTYAKTFGGLMACYAAGLPFFGYTVAGDLFYVMVIFGAFEFMKQRFPKLVAA